MCFFHFFEVLIFWAVKGVKGKNSPKGKIAITSVMCLIFRKSKACDYYIWYNCVKCWYLQVFFHLFLKFSFFRQLRGKRARNSPKWKIFIFVTRHISGTVTHMIIIYVTLVLNDDISVCFFHFFEVFIFWAARG